MNVIDRSKGNLITQGNPRWVRISKDDCYRVLPMSKDWNLELHLTRQLNSLFVNNYFDVALKAWQANKDVHPDIYVSKFLENWWSAFTSHETNSQGSLWEQHTSSGGCSNAPKAKKIIWQIQLIGSLTYLVKRNSSNKTSSCFKAWHSAIKNVFYANSLFLGLSLCISLYCVANHKSK